MQISRIVVACLCCFTIELPADALASGLDDARAGRGALRDNRYEAAIRLFTAAIGSGELSARDLGGTYFARGSAYADTRAYTLAIADFDEAIHFLPDYAPAYYNRGSAYAAINKYDFAERDLTRAIDLKPDYEEAMVNRGTVYYQQKQYAKAISDFKAAIKLNPQDAIAYNKIGIAYIADDKWIWACGNFKKAIELKPDFEDAIENYKKQCGK